MKKLIRRIVLTGFFLFLTAAMLLFPKQALYYALTGLTLWFEKMIPTLLPFMILTNLLVSLRLTDSFTSFFKPILGRLFHLDGNGVYTVLIGFLCGFPMGAKVAADLYRKNMLSLEDSQCLLIFCNNIGPIYFTGFVMQLLQIKVAFPFLVGMYGIPFLYGLILCRFRKVRPSSCAQTKMLVKRDSDKLLDILDDSITSGLISITKLGGYMVLFNLLNLIPSILFPAREYLLHPVNCLLEITSGISRIGSSNPFLVLVLLPFGGFSCIAQTYSMIKGTELSIQKYIVHKILLTGITAVYYFCIFQIKSVEFFY